MQAHLLVHEEVARKQGHFLIAGTDEAGRGPLAGPVVAAAVILFPACEKENFRKTSWTEYIRDSKALTPKKRSFCYDLIYENAFSVGIGIVDAAEIDRVNILEASLYAMAVAVENLAPYPDMVLVDGNRKIKCLCPQSALVGGDRASASIAAASIVAKVTRDRMMERYDMDYPGFAFSRHKGYPTKEHKEAIRKNGHTPIHRKTFKGVVEFVKKPC